jgi:hypothetical protein
MRVCSEHTRTLVGAALLSLSLATAAQVAPQRPAPAKQPTQEAAKADPTEVVATGTLIAIPLTPMGEPQAGEKAPAAGTKEGAAQNPFNMFRSAGPGEMDQLMKQAEERRQQLRQQLADPKQRERVRAERLPQVRSMYPDIGRVLRLDPKTEEQLIAVLLDHAIEAELDGRGFSMRSSLRASSSSLRASSSSLRASRSVITAIDEATIGRAKAYTRRMQELSQAIGAGRLDAFIDYRSSMPHRLRTEAFDTSLPGEHKLSPEQKDAMSLVLAKDAQRQLQGWRNQGLSRLTSLLPGATTAEERNRTLQMYSLAATERNLERQEIAQREVQEELATVLTPEQSKAFAQQQQQMLGAQRAWAVQQRTSLGLRADEVLDAPTADTAAPLLSSDLRLQVEFNIDGKRTAKTLVSKRGGPVSWQTPEGLQIELQPYLVDSDQVLMTEVKVYETVRGGKRLAHQSAGSISITNPRKGTPGGKSGGSASVIEGRKGYAFNWSGLATFL